MKLQDKRIRKGLVLLLFFFLSLPFLLSAQTKVKKAASNSDKGPDDFPELIFTNIQGAPKLSKPKLITGRLAPVIGEGMGWASPAVYDWDGDGKKDLLIGEFSSGLQFKVGIGSFVRVYQNEGTEKQPAFSGIYEYAKGKRAGKEDYGTPLSIYTWCCMAFTPRFVDLDNDGYSDLVTGQYEPGFITWFRGSEEGFLPGQRLEQAGNPLISKPGSSVTDTTSFNYWSYSAVAFGDFDGDGDSDMIVGGEALRMSENIGSKTIPKFGIRKFLQDVNDKPLSINKWGRDHGLAGGSTVPYVVDWDNDGILDLLVTSSYSANNGTAAVTYFKGLKTVKGLRFEPGVALFSAKTGGKALPGSYPNICVADWNNDGVNDLVIGTSVATLKEKFDYPLSWSWEQETETLKENPAYTSLATYETIKKQIEDAEAEQKKLGWSDEKMRQEGKATKKGILALYYGKPEYMNLAHQGYVYVMLGSNK